MMKQTKELKDRLEKAEKMSCKPDFMRLKDGYITNEDRSVKWNREQVIKNHEAYDAEVKRLNREKNAAKEAAIKEVLDAIQEDLIMSLDEKARKSLWSYAYAHGHSSGLDEVFFWLDEVVDLANCVLRGFAVKKGEK